MTKPRTHRDQKTDEKGDTEGVAQTAPPVAPTETADRRAGAVTDAESTVGRVVGSAGTGFASLRTHKTAVGTVVAAVAGSAALGYWKGRSSTDRGVGLLRRSKGGLG